MRSLGRTTSLDCLGSDGSGVRMTWTQSAATIQPPSIRDRPINRKIDFTRISSLSHHTPERKKAFDATCSKSTRAHPESRPKFIGTGENWRNGVLLSHP